MHRLFHLALSPACRLIRLALGEKRIVFEATPADDPGGHLPVFVDADGTRTTGLWAVVDHIENEHPDHPLVPEDPQIRGEVLRVLDWTMTHFHEEATRRIVFEKAARAQTGSTIHRPPNMDTVRMGREALRTILPRLGQLADTNGFIAAREMSLADLALAGHLSALDYFGEIPWADCTPLSEWYSRMKSRPSFRPLLADRVPGQPPVPHYAELDF